MLDGLLAKGFLGVFDPDKAGNIGIVGEEDPTLGGWSLGVGEIAEEAAEKFVGGPVGDLAGAGTVVARAALFAHLGAGFAAHGALLEGSRSFHR